VSEIKVVFERFTGVDIAAKDFTAAIMSPGAKPKLEPKPFRQTGYGFQHFIQRLREQSVPASSHLIVLEATGSYWVALAVALHEAGFVVAVVNPAQAHYFAKAQLKRVKTDALDAQTGYPMGANSLRLSNYRAVNPHLKVITNFASDLLNAIILANYVITWRINYTH